MNHENYDVEEITHRLIQINSEAAQSPEDNVRIYIESILDPSLWKRYYQQMSPGRTNLLAKWEPSDDSSSIPLILFSGHMDTVIGYTACKSDQAENDGYYIWGRGACDMKGGIAAFIVAIQNWIHYTRKKNQYGDVSNQNQKFGIVLAFTVDEERGCIGVQYFNSPEITNIFNRIKICILAEPTNLFPVYAHKGINWYQLIFKGIAAHASVPDQGDNAIMKATNFIHEIEQYSQALREKQSPLGCATINVGTIHGGTQTNVIPDKCEITLDRRFVPNEDPKNDEKIIKEIAYRIDPSVDFHAMTPGYAYLLPFGDNNIIFKFIKDICLNFQPEKNFHSPSQTNPNILPAYTEADIYYRFYHIPTIILGPGKIEQAHQVPEFIECEQLHRAIQIYQKILDAFEIKLIPLEK
jgi:acetylornithine deacetylase/succinyl-diaminopimelate desuccinylase-like protein